MNKPGFKWTRRDLIKLGFMSGAATLIGGRSAWGQSCVDQTPMDISLAETGCGVIEEFPVSPFILNPFRDMLPIPQALRPGYRQPDGTLDPAAADAWTVRILNGRNQRVISAPGPGAGRQDALGARPRVSVDQFGIAGAPGTTYNLPDAGTHQLWTDGSGVSGSAVAGSPWFPMPNPILYHIRVQVRPASFTTSAVRPIDKDGIPVTPPPTAVFDSVKGGYILPPSTIYGFNGTFPGPMINLEYGKPVIVRFENDLDLNEGCLDRQDFGAPDWAFLTHQHNGHTAPESDGQPHHLTDHEGGYQPGEWCDNLYLNYPAGGDPNEMQSFLWFHDHRMHHTGPNVYKGMVGLTPYYDPALDPGDETGVVGKGKNRKVSKKALHLPGRRVDNPDGSFDVKYDIPLALYDCALDDGVTQHEDVHNGCGELHPEWWGKTFFRHFPNHGFVGDIFTVNGVAYPVLHVFQRKYRFRVLDCSVSRIYQLWLMRGTPQAAPGTQGQWQLSGAQQCMKFTQIASEGGLLPAPIVRNSFEMWPAKRREVVVDFTRYLDNSKTRPGDELYLVNSLQMSTGRKPDNFPADPNVPGNYLVPMMKIVIDGPPPEKDVSTVPNQLRPMPAMLGTPATLPQRQFTLQRGSPANGTLPGSSETEWLINSLQFDPVNPLAMPKRGQPEVWTVQNGGGGWVHPMHMHMEEHHVLFRNGIPAPDALHPDDTGKEDVAALYPSEAVTFYRNFRTFAGKYVAHCHNLAHEDHNMMFGWTIIP
jgi:FtsP/CotA-like multicopper oxidase with cupredoxin domain